MNTDGQVVGRFWNGTEQVFSWESGSFNELPEPVLPDTTRSFGVSVNAHGHFIGYATQSKDGRVPAMPRIGFLYSPGSGFSQIVGPDGHERMQSASINDNGAIVGVYYPQFDSSTGKPFLLANGVAQSLDDVFQMTGKTPVAINNSNQIIANYDPQIHTEVPEGVAVLYSDGIARLLLPPVCDTTQAVAINDAGVVLLRGKLKNSNVVRPFLYQAGTYVDMTQLPAGEGFTLDCEWTNCRPTPHALNNAGQVVGGINDRPVLFSGGQFVELAPLASTGGRRFWPTGINEQGQILAQIFESVTDSYGHACVLSPSAEPPPSPEPEPEFPKATYRYRVGMDSYQRAVSDLSEGGVVVGNVWTAFPLYSYTGAFAWDRIGGMRSLKAPSPHPDVTLETTVSAVDVDGRIAVVAVPHSQVGGGGAFIFQGGIYEFIPGVERFSGGDGAGKFLALASEAEQVGIYDATRRALTWIDALEGTEPVAMNIHGDVVGNRGSSAFLYSQGTLTYLPLLPGGSYTVAIAINASGLVLAKGDIDVGIEHYFLYHAGTVVDLNLLPGAASFRTPENQSTLNDLGEVIGSVGEAPIALMSDPGEGYKPVIYRDGTFTEVVLPADQENPPFSVSLSGRNNSDFMVGNATYADSRYVTLGYFERELTPTPPPESTPTPEPTATPVATPEPTATPEASPVPGATQTDVRPERPQLRGKGVLKTDRSKIRLTGWNEKGSVLQYKNGKGKFRRVTTKGRWSLPVNLKEGRNVVRFLALSPDGLRSRVKRVVIFRR